MAKQGNYVTVPGASQNWAAGTGDALANLSKTLLAQSEAEKERDRLAEAAEQERLRYEERRADRLERNRIEDDRNRRIEDRNKELHDITVGNHKTAQDKKAWVRDLDASSGMDAIRRRKAKNIYGVTDEQLNSDKGRDILDAVNVYQEDLDRYYGKQYSNRFGDKFDPSLVRSKYGDVSSLQALQEAENEKAELFNDRLSKIIDDQISSSKGLLGEGSGNSRSSSGSRSGKGPETYSHILVNDLVKSFQDEYDWLPIGSARKDAQEIATTLLTALQNDKTNKVTPSEAVVVVKKTLDSLRTGENLGSINTDDHLVKSTAVKALKDLREGASSGSSSASSGIDYDATGRKVLTRFSTGEDLGYYQPKNVKEHRIAQARKRIDEILGRVPPQSSEPKQERLPNVTTENSTFNENSFLRNIGLGEPTDEEVEVADKPSPPKTDYTKVAEDFRNTLSRNGDYSLPAVRRQLAKKEFLELEKDLSILRRRIADAVEEDSYYSDRRLKRFIPEEKELKSRLDALIEKASK